MTRQNKFIATSITVTTKYLKKGDVFEYSTGKNKLGTGVIIGVNWIESTKSCGGRSMATAGCVNQREGGGGVSHDAINNILVEYFCTVKASKPCVK